MTPVWERVLASAMRAADPVAQLRAASEDPRLAPPLRRAFARAVHDENGVRIAALLIAKLRFERITRGGAGDWFEREPAAFAAAFRRYHAEVPMRATFPRAEAREFRDWCERAGLRGAID